MKKRIYSREFYKTVINNLARDIDTQTMINAVSLATLLLPKDKLYEEVDVDDDKKAPEYDEVERLVKRLPDVNEDSNFKMTPLTDTTVKDDAKLFDLSDLSKKAHVDVLAARTWLLEQGITPSGYGNNINGVLVAGYRKEVFDRLVSHAWEINNDKKGDVNN